MSPGRFILILIPIAYLCGCIPFGLFVGLTKGIDPRKAGSGNIGATNVGRLLGGKYFALVFILDLLKGALPVLAAGFILHFRPDNRNQYLLWIAMGVAAIVGHMFNVFLGFKGGKGVATSAGVMLGLFPYFTFPGLLGMTAWFIIFKTTRYVSVASMLGALCFTLLYIAIGIIFHWPLTAAQLPLLCFAILIPLLIIYRHRANIARLRAGTENRSPRKPAA